MENLVWWEREILLDAGRRILRGPSEDPERDELEHIITTPGVG